MRHPSFDEDDDQSRSVIFRVCLIVLATLCFLAPRSCIAAGDVDRGAIVFDGYCAECHQTEANAPVKKGPTLFRIVGRRAGQIPGFDYSPANKSIDLVFDEPTLERYLTLPKAVIPGTKMSTFPGIPTEPERRDLIAYLATLK